MVFLLAASAAFAIDPLPFTDAQEEYRFRNLTAELRCVLCQNQSLADSNAGIAKDLRNQIFTLMREGKNDDEIKSFLVERYSDFVLYRPPFRPATAMLWLAPFAIVIAGAISIVLIVRRRSAALRVALCSEPNGSGSGQSEPNQSVLDQSVPNREEW